MIQITKIFYFEMAHAIAGYEGACSDIHGHSYVLHVTVKGVNQADGYIMAPGMLFDFKQLKAIVHDGIIRQLDHKLLLSANFLKNKKAAMAAANLVIWEVEPTAENMVIFMQSAITELLPPGINLVSLKLYETKDSYAEWLADRH
jgi:6-pyruvoyltetrahydropterin/6-carboxytetrahydropterin synthase